MDLSWKAVATNLNPWPYAAASPIFGLYRQAGQTLLVSTNANGNRANLAG
jgi:hypothetical protein